MSEQKSMREIIHDIANDVSIARGMVRSALRTMNEAPPDTAKAMEKVIRSEKALEKLEGLVVELRNIIRAQEKSS